MAIFAGQSVVLTDPAAIKRFGEGPFTVSTLDAANHAVELKEIGMFDLHGVRAAQDDPEPQKNRGAGLYDPVSSQFGAEKPIPPEQDDQDDNTITGEDECQPSGSRLGAIERLAAEMLSSTNAPLRQYGKRILKLLWS